MAKEILFGRSYLIRTDHNTVKVHFINATITNLLRIHNIIIHYAIIRFQIIIDYIDWLFVPS